MKIIFLLKILIAFNLYLSLVCCQSDSQSILYQYDFNGNNHLKIKLPNELKEISGLALAGNNKVYTHDDEIGKVYKINLESGSVDKIFKVGENKIKKDFEGIAVADEYIYLVTSDGTLYKFREGDDDDEVEYIKIKTGLKQENNVEGLCYDSITNSLLLACKDIPGIGLKGYKAVYSFNLDEKTLDENPRFLISLDYLKEEYGIKDFSPSGIERHPVNGTFFIISANSEAVIEISADGKLLDGYKLDKKKHKQPEGITFTNHLDLALSDEANGNKAKITLIKLTE
jgi:uncharacterized protein YjiK